MDVGSLKTIGDLAPGADTGDLGQNIARAARDSFCGVYNSFPEWYLSGPSILPSVANVPKMIGDSICRRVPPVVDRGSVPFKQNGGQCAKEYEAAITSYWTDFSDQSKVTVGTYRSVGFGPLTFNRNDVITTQSGGQKAYSARVQVTDRNGTVRDVIAGEQGKRINDVQFFTRVKDGTADNCGNPPDRPFPVPTGNNLVIPTPVPVPGGPPVIIPVIIPVGVLVKPTLQINVGPVNVNFNLGGVTLSPTFKGPDINLRPSEPQPSTGTQRPNSDGTDTGEGLPPATKCPDPCPPAIEFVTISVDVGQCAFDSGEWKFSTIARSVKVIKGEEDRTTEEFKQLLTLTKAECFARNGRKGGQPTIIGSGKSSIGQRTFTVDIDNAVLSVYLDIIGPLPPGVSLYSLQSNNEEQGRIGNISLAIAGGPSSGRYQTAEPGWIWTKRTYLNVGKVGGKSRSIRINLKPDIQWVLYDSGERESTRSYT